MASAALADEAKTSSASPAACNTPTAAAAPAKASLVCPVTGDKIASVKDAAGKSTYKGKTYYFCCSQCKPMFDKDPAKYVKSASAPAKSAASKTAKT